MFKLFITVIIALLMHSCSLQRNVTMVDDGFYIGKLNTDLIFNYIILIRIKDSTATIETYLEQKGMLTGYNIFNGQVMLPNSESFHFQKIDQRVILSNSLNKIILKAENNGSLKMENPLKLKLKYHRTLPSNLYPSKKYALYCYCWFYPHVILGIEEELPPLCKLYINNKMDQNLKNLDEHLNYEDYFMLIRDSITHYKFDYENTYKK